MNSSLFEGDDTFPYDAHLLTLDTANTQAILIVAAGAISLLKAMLASASYSYFHPFMSALSFAFLGLAFVMFLMHDFQEERGLDADDPDSFYGDSLSLYLVTYITGCFTELVNFCLTLKTVNIYYRMRQVHPDQTTAAIKKSAGSRVRCTIVIGSIVPILIPIIGFAKTNFATEKFLPFDFDDQNGQLLLIAAYHVELAVFATCVATFAIGRFGLMRCVGQASQVLFLIQSGLFCIVLARVSDRGAGGLTFLAMMTAFQTIEFTSEYARLGEWFVLANPVEEENDGDEPADPNDTENQTTPDREHDPAFPLESSVAATGQDTYTFMESESLTMGSRSLEEKHPGLETPAAPRSVAASETSNTSEDLDDDFRSYNLEVGDLFTMKQ